MAQFDKVNGDYQPVVVMDSGVVASAPGAGWNSGLNAVVSGATVQPQGPKLDYFTVTFDGVASGDNINTAIQTIQQLATVYIYQYNATDDDTLAVAIYPTGAWVASAMPPANGMQEALVAAGLTGATVATGAEFAG